MKANKDITRLNYGTAILAVIIAIIAILVYKGTVRFLDTPFGFVREQLFNIRLEKITLIFLIAASFFIALIKIVRFIKRIAIIIRLTINENRCLK